MDYRPENKKESTSATDTKVGRRKLLLTESQLRNAGGKLLIIIRAITDVKTTRLKSEGEQVVLHSTSISLS